VLCLGSVLFFGSRVLHLVRVKAVFVYWCLRTYVVC